MSLSTRWGTNGKFIRTLFPSPTNYSLNKENERTFNLPFLVSSFLRYFLLFFFCLFSFFSTLLNCNLRIMICKSNISYLQE